MSIPAVIRKLADTEEHFFVPGPERDLKLFLRLLKSAKTDGAVKGPVLYVHGATFPSGLSIAHRFDGRSWRDALCDAGFDVWGLDLYGFGHSDRFPQMNLPAGNDFPLGLAESAALQVAAAVQFILEHSGARSISIVAHSWGSIVAGRFAGEHPAWVDRLVFFAPICLRKPSRYLDRPSGPAWRAITAEDQWNRFVEDVPPDEQPVLSRLHFDQWAQAYLDSDPQSRSLDIPAVKVPSGPYVEILRAWQGELAYEPSKVQAPVAIIRGSWDGLVTDADASWLFAALKHAPNKRDIKIGRGTHLMHLECMRFALWSESIAFLSGNDVAPIPQT